MKALLTQILSRLQANVPALKYIDEDWGQLDYYSPHHPVQWPCALVDASQAQWTNKGHHGQLGLLQVKVTVADMRLSNTSTRAPKSQQQAAFEIYDVIAAVHGSLHGWAAAPTATALVRTSSSRRRRDDGVRIYDITYTCQLADESTQPQQASHRIQQVAIAQPAFLKT